MSRIGKPMSRRVRAMLAGCLLLAAVVLGFGISIALYQTNREMMRSSDLLGYLLCGEGQHIDDAPSKSRGRRMICRAADGTEISARNNLIAVKMALPFIMLIGIPALWFAMTADLREVRRR